MTEEKWKPIIGYEGYYDVSNLGRIRSLTRQCGLTPRGYKRTIKGQILHPTDNGHGYLIVSLKRNGSRKNIYLHRAVASAFIDNTYHLSIVNHKDFNTKNNQVDNLEWCSQKQNIVYSAERMKHCKSKSKPTNTGYKYIYQLKSNKFRLSIKGSIDRSFNNLNDAIRKRDEIIEKKC